MALNPFTVVFVTFSRSFQADLLSLMLKIIYYNLILLIYLSEILAYSLLKIIDGFGIPILKGRPQFLSLDMVNFQSSRKRHSTLILTRGK